jgi:rhodanese-related sulfurtransferase
MTRIIDQLLDQARAWLRRLDPHQAAAIAASGGLLVDIRPAAQRAEEGEIPGAIILERNVLEWRLDPASPHRIPEVQGHDQPIVILCSEGYTSSLAAAVLQDLGLHQATDPQLCAPVGGARHRDRKVSRPRQPCWAYPWSRICNPCIENVRTAGELMRPCRTLPAVRSAALGSEARLPLP